MNEGLIIGSIDFKENSKIIYLLTKDGKDSLLVHKAKNIKSENNNLTQILNKVKYEKTGKGSLAVASLLEIDNYNYEIKNDLKKYACISYVLEIINNHLTDNQNYNMLYNLLDKYISELTIRDDYLMMLLEIKIKLLYFLGINPNFYSCHYCGTTKNLVGLSIKNGSVECKNHISNDNIGLNETKIIELLYKDKSLEIKYDDINTLTYLYQVIDKYYETHLDIKFKSDKVLKQLKII